jgi:hypothetical protein
MGAERFDPFTERLTDMPLEEDVGVIKTDPVDAVLGVAPVIVQAYVGLDMLNKDADKVAFGGVKAPPAFCVNDVYPLMSTDEAETPLAPGLPLAPAAPTT